MTPPSPRVFSALAVRLVLGTELMTISCQTVAGGPDGDFLTRLSLRPEAIGRNVTLRQFICASESNITTTLARICGRPSTSPKEVEKCVTFSKRPHTSR